MTFRHALVRDAFYGEVPWTRRVALHREVAQRLEAAHAAPLVVAEHWALGQGLTRPGRRCWRRRRRSAAFTLPGRGLTTRRALELWPDEGDEPARLVALERLAGCSELAGDLVEAATTRWRSPTGAGGRAIRPYLGAALRRLAGARAPGPLAGGAGQLSRPPSPSPPPAWRLRPPPNGLPRPPTRSAASFAALSLLETAGQQARSAGRVDLQARILGQEGNVRTRMGQGQEVELVRAGLAMALEQGLAGAAAEIYHRLADFEHTGDYRAATEAYDEAAKFCAANALEPTAQLCRACLTAVLRQTGDWDRAVALCRQVIDSADATLHARAVATGNFGSILGLRGQTRRPGRCCWNRSP